jgi:hypothetical protein
MPRFLPFVPENTDLRDLMIDHVLIRHFGMTIASSDERKKNSH